MISACTCLPTKRVSRYKLGAITSISMKNKDRYLKLVGYLPTDFHLGFFLQPEYCEGIKKKRKRTISDSKRYSHYVSKDLLK